MSDSSRIIECLKRCGELCPFSFTLVAIERDDQPLIYVNAVFKSLTQFNDSEILGKNCRFLQGPGSNKDTVIHIRNAIQQRDLVCQDLLNYKKDGTTFWNRLLLFPMETEDECFYVGLQHDVTKKKGARSSEPVPGLPAGAESEMSRWIKNRFHLAFMKLDVLDPSESEKAIQRVRDELEKISACLWFLD